jgi:hypothetical protein
MADTTFDFSQADPRLKFHEQILKAGKPTYKLPEQSKLDTVRHYILELRRYYMATTIYSWLGSGTTYYELTDADKLQITRAMKEDIEVLKAEYPSLNLKTEIAVLDREIQRYLGDEN